MLKRRRHHRIKRNVQFSSATRRRVMRKNAHKKVIWRRRLFAVQQMEELEKLKSLITGEC